MAAGFDSQITRLDQRIDNTAEEVAMALTGSSLPSDKHFSAAFNIGTFGGQTAIGISQFPRASNNIVVSGCVALQDRQVGGRAGVMKASGEQERFVWLCSQRIHFDRHERGPLSRNFQVHHGLGGFMCCQCFGIPSGRSLCDA
jgi:hypothetical protein